MSRLDRHRVQARFHDYRDRLRVHYHAARLGDDDHRDVSTEAEGFIKR
jgi:hypothetical protein